MENKGKITPVYSQVIPGFGDIQLRHFSVETDSEWFHSWITQDYAVFWGMQYCTKEQVKEEYTKLATPADYDVLVGEYNGKPAFVVEQYVPQNDIIGNFYTAKKTDSGIHIIVAPPSLPKIENFTWHVFTSIMDFVFSNISIERIVVEPDIGNKKMFALCQRIGFKLSKVIELPHKTAQLAFLERSHYQKLKKISKITKRSAMNSLDNIVSPQQSVAHLQPQVWEQANRLLIKKCLTEFSHELLLTPVKTVELANDWACYEIKKVFITYKFKAKKLALNHYLIETNTIQKEIDGIESSLDVILFIKEFQGELGIETQKMPVYLEEIISTLYGSAFKITKGNPTVAELATADFQTIEQSMTEGHPGFVANNGRIGFDSSDYRSYAPEAGNSFGIVWLAGHKSNTVYAALENLPYEKLIAQELSAETIESFQKKISDTGKDPQDYLFIPMHPWQWFNKLANIFSTEIATQDLICLGYGPDQYMAQQSIRTLFNISNPHKYYTKTALSILNMGFMRGLPLYYLGTAPKMAVWLENLLYSDGYIQETGFKMLGEIASVSYVNPYFEQFGVHNDYNKMLASLWRESPISAISETQKPITMAAFLHIDHNGEALLPHIIKTSGLTINNWLRKYFKAYLSPLVHCFYHFDLVFMPHGENIIMVMEDNMPVSILLKDITEEACILSPDVELPEHLKRMYAPVPEDVKLLSVFTDIFDGFFRYMSAILEEHAQFSEHDFWQLVAENIQDYQNRYPEHQNKFEQYDLFASDFHLSCLNRLQLNNNKQMIDLDDPVALLQFAGRLQNPLAAFKHKLTNSF